MIVLPQKIIVYLTVLVFFSYPMISSYSRVILVVISLSSILLLISYKPKIKASHLKQVLFMNLNLIIFLIVATISLFVGNNISYVFFDSAGFVFYIVLTPIILLIVKERVNIVLFVDFFIKIGLLFSVLSILLFMAFSSIFGQLTLATITEANNLIQNYINLKLGATGGVLRINTNTVQILLISFYLTLMDNKLTILKKNIFLGILFLGIAVDGHWVIIISVTFLLFFYLILYKKYFLLSFFSVVVFLSFLLSLDSFNQKLETKNGSASIRASQVEPLLAEINKHPIIGNGFGSSASLIRNELRPFMYEVDFLATMMKLGIPLTLVYTLLWFMPLLFHLKLGIRSSWFQFSFIFIILSIFYMISNGGFYLSPLTPMVQYSIILSLMYTHEIYHPQKDDKQFNI